MKLSNIIIQFWNNYSLTENKTVTKVISKMDGSEKDEEKLDQILDKVKKVDDTCDYKGCKQVIL